MVRFPMAFKLCWQYPGEEIDECVKQVHQMGSKIWVNTIWASLCGGLGNDDDAALAAKNPADVYGQYRHGCIYDPDRSS